MKIRVYYEDTDCGGVVYHSQYLNFCERARSELFFEKGLSPHSRDGFFVVKSLHADFIKPARLGDTLTITTEMLRCKKASMKLQQKILKNHELLFEVTLTVAYLENFRPAKIPVHILDLFKGL